MQELFCTILLVKEQITNPHIYILSVENRGGVPGEPSRAAGLRVRRPRHPRVQPPPAHLAGLPALPEDTLRGLSQYITERNVHQ